MSIRRIDTVFKNNTLEFFQDLFDTFPELIQETAETTFRRYKQPLLDELRHMPPERSWPGDYPIEWTSERQRRAYFATDGFGAGIPYVRSNALADGWRARVVVQQDRTLIEIRNNRAYAPYVVGKLRRRGDDPQQRFHRITGWKPVSVTIDYWTVAFADEFHIQFGRLLGKRR